MRFTTAFGLNQNQAGLDFVDIDPDEDIPLFFDPYVFANEGDPFCDKCDESLRSFFQRVLDHIGDNELARGRALLSYLSEPNEICFGWSKGEPSGRGIGRKQAGEIFDRLAASDAAKSGLLTDLAGCELFVDGIGPDKISDITANIIRSHLIEYTQEQCALHGIQDLNNVPVGHTWDVQNCRWNASYVNLPVIGDKPVVLVPKKLVRWIGDLSHQHQKYYRHFVLNFLRDQNLRNDTALVHILSDGSRRVYKTELAEKYPLSKDFLFRFSRDNPKVFNDYREAYAKTHSVSARELDEDFNDALFVDAIKKQLASIPPGTQDATRFHRLMVGVLEYLFYPNLTYPKIEDPLHQGRKRIDIRYTNAAKSGFFYRIATQYQLTSIHIMVECKNYRSDPKNPELDQLAGRFGPNRGKVGLLIARTFENRDLFIQRCRDTALDQRGVIIPLVDQDLCTMLDLAAAHKRSEIDRYIEDIFRQII